MITRLAVSRAAHRMAPRLRDYQQLENTRPIDLNGDAGVNQEGLRPVTRSASGHDDSDDPDNPTRRAPRPDRPRPEEITVADLLAGYDREIELGREIAHGPRSGKGRESGNGRE